MSLRIFSRHKGLQPKFRRNHITAVTMDRATGRWEAVVPGWEWTGSDIPSRELTYPPKNSILKIIFWTSQGGICLFPGGYTVSMQLYNRYMILMIRVMSLMIILLIMIILFYDHHGQLIYVYSIRFRYAPFNSFFELLGLVELFLEAPMFFSWPGNRIWVYKEVCQNSLLVGCRTNFVAFVLHTLMVHDVELLSLQPLQHPVEPRCGVVWRRFFVDQA